MDSFDSNSELIAAIEREGLEVRTLGHTMGGEPIVSVRTGGDKQPPVVMTAGSHATEQAGVSAAVELAYRLETDHETHVVPTRDPVGLNGYAFALKEAVGSPVQFNPYRELESLLQSDGEVVYREEDAILSLVGDYGFASKRPTAEASSAMFLKDLLTEYEYTHPEVLEPFAGRRIFLPGGLPEVVGTENFRRAYTLLISPDNSLQHLNRFFEAGWAPIETRGVRNLLAEVEPGLFFDIHEAVPSGDRYWMTMRHQTDEDDESWEERIGQAAVDAVEGAGGSLAPVTDLTGDIPRKEHWFKEVDPGLFWLESDVRNQGEPPEDADELETTPGVTGLNATDFAGEQYGLAFTSETGMLGPFDHRVEMAVTAVQRAVTEFEKRHR